MIRALLVVALLGLAACGPLPRPAPFPGARGAVPESRLEGPFDGVVLDAGTDEPLAGALVVGIWSFDRGDGLAAPAGSVVVRTTTDPAGRYRVPRLPRRPRGPALRLSRFVLVVYKRGYAAYRSDAAPDGRTRTDFTVRQARIRLTKWREQDAHALHLAYLAPPSVLEGDVMWAYDAANAELAGRTAPAEARPEPEGAGAAPARADTVEVLDATAVLPPDEVIRKTGFIGTFDVADLGDLPPTAFYHGLHLEAVDHDETWDVAVRVWKDPPGGLDEVRATFEATLPGVEPGDAVTDTTWVYDAEDVRAVAFLDTDRNAAVLLSCGGNLCPDTATAIVLARMVHERLDELGTRTVPKAAAATGEQGTDAQEATAPAAGTESTGQTPAGSGDADRNGADDGGGTERPADRTSHGDATDGAAPSGEGGRR